MQSTSSAWAEIGESLGSLPGANLIPIAGLLFASATGLFLLHFGQTYRADWRKISPIGPDTIQALKKERAARALWVISMLGTVSLFFVSVWMLWSAHGALLSIMCVIVLVVFPAFMFWAEYGYDET